MWRPKAELVKKSEIELHWLSQLTMLLIQVKKCNSTLLKSSKFY